MCSLKISIIIIIIIIFFLILISFITIFYQFTFFVGAAQRQNKATERADKLASCNFMIVYKLNAECRVES